MCSMNDLMLVYSLTIFNLFSSTSTVEDIVLFQVYSTVFSLFVDDEIMDNTILDLVELGNRFTDQFISTAENIAMLLTLLDVSS